MKSARTRANAFVDEGKEVTATQCCELSKDSAETFRFAIIVKTLQKLQVTAEQSESEWPLCNINSLEIFAAQFLLIFCCSLYIFLWQFLAGICFHKT